MKRILSQSLVFLLLLLILTILRFPYSDYAERQLELLLSKARAAGVTASIDATTVHFPGSLDLSGVYLEIPTAVERIPFTIERLSLHPAFLPLFLLRGEVTGQSSVYGGTISTKLSRPFFGETLYVSGIGTALKLAAHPFISSYGIVGTLDVQSEGEVNIRASARRPLAALADGLLELKLIDASYAGGHKLKGLITLPAVSDINISMAVRKRTNSISLTRFSVNSSLGTMSGGGTIIDADLGQRASIELELRIELSPAGQKALAGYLALAAGIPVDQGAAIWNLSVLKNKLEPTFRTVISPAA